MPNYYRLSAEQSSCIRVKCCHKHLIMWFNSKEMLTGNTQVRYKWMWTYCPQIQAVPWLLTCPDTIPGQWRVAAGTSPLAAPSRAELLTCTQPPPAQEEMCQQKSQEYSPGCREGNFFRVITYGNTLTFPPNYPNTVVPGKYGVHSHRLVILKLGKSHCTVFICYSKPEFCFWSIWKSIVYCTSSLFTVRITCAGAVGVFSGQRLKSISVEQCLRVLPAHEETAHSFTDALNKTN